MSDRTRDINGVNRQNVTKASTDNLMSQFSAKGNKYPTCWIEDRQE